jgi:hypothetical protein
VITDEVDSIIGVRALIDQLADHATPNDLDPVLDTPIGPGPEINPEPVPSRTPWFQVGNAKGAVGDIVEVPVIGGCVYHIDGFHIGGGLGGPTNKKTGGSGYGTLRLDDVVLGSYLTDYFQAQGMIADDGSEMFYSDYQMATWANDGALPEEFWEFAIGFFSVLSKEEIKPVTIPSGTELFKLKIEILPAAHGRGTLPLSCRDNYYYTQQVYRRRDYTYTYPPQGFTQIETADGELTIL